MDQLKPPPELDFSTTGHTSLPKRWHHWKQAMQLYVELTMKNKSQAVFFFTSILFNAGEEDALVCHII